MELDHLSPSQYGTFSRCELQYGLRYLLHLTVPPMPNMTIGTATHKGVEYAYSEKKESDTFKPDDCRDVTRDIIENDDITEWNDKLSKGKAKDFSISMVTAYLDEKYLDNVRQEMIKGIETKIDIEFGGDIIVPHVIGYADIWLADSIIDLKTGARKQTKPSGSNFIQNSLYCHALGVDNSYIHNLSYNKKGESTAIDFPVPIMNVDHMGLLFRTFWKRLLTMNEIEDFQPTGLNHDWACSYCGYGRTGLCPYKMKLTGG